MNSVYQRLFTSAPCRSVLSVLPITSLDGVLHRGGPVGPCLTGSLTLSYLVLSPCAQLWLVLRISVKGRALFCKHNREASAPFLSHVTTRLVHHQSYPFVLFAAAMNDKMGNHEIRQRPITNNVIGVHVSFFSPVRKGICCLCLICA